MLSPIPVLSAATLAYLTRGILFNLIFIHQEEMCARAAPNLGVSSNRYPFPSEKGENYVKAKTPT